MLSGGQLRERLCWHTQGAEVVRCSNRYLETNLDIVPGAQLYLQCLNRIHVCFQIFVAESVFTNFVWLERAPQLN